jgi:hypothetical protein
MQKDNDDGRNESTDGDSAGAGAGNDKNQTKNDRGSDSDSGSWNGWVVGETVMLPTKTHDGGGGLNVQRSDHQEGESNGGGGSRSDEASRTSRRPDSFQTYSDTDTRMSTLLGLEPVANPNDGEEQEDWRQLTGFRGLGDRRRRDDDEVVAAQAAPNGNGDTTTTPRNTRISWELHNLAFEHMWIRRGEINAHDAEPIRPRAEPLGEQENQNEQDDEESRQNEQG